MSWDDEDFDIPTTAPAAASWEDQDEEPLMDSWDVDEDEVAKQKKAEADKKKAELKKKQDDAKAKKLAAKSGEVKLMDIDMVDEATRRELLRKAELVADLNNAADLFGGLGVASDNLDDVIAHPRERLAVKLKPVVTRETPLEELPVFQPSNKQEFEKLRKTIGPILTDLAEDSLLNYSSSLAIDLIRDLVQPLSVADLRKVISTLQVAQREKEKQERLARLLKSGGTATGGAGKKKAKPLVKTNNNESFKLDEDFDDFGDDDFM